MKKQILYQKYKLTTSINAKSSLSIFPQKYLSELEDTYFILKKGEVKKLGGNIYKYFLPEIMWD